jgi:hypothetical protein
MAGRRIDFEPQAMIGSRRSLWIETLAIGLWGGIEIMHRSVLGLLVLALVAAPAQAQTGRMELGASLGWTLSEGVEINSFNFDEVNPESGFSYGFEFGFFANRMVEIGFLASQQQSNLLGEGGIMGPNSVSVPLDVDNFHGFVAYHFSLGDNPATPFLLFGMGATYYDTGDLMNIDLDNETQFSTTWGGGVKVYPSGSPLGAKFMGRWTPTYIKTDEEGVWCDPYYGCTSYGDVEYSNQFEMSAGAIYRF